jgi:predicted GNAT superfamily acetyltransferase
MAVEIRPIQAHDEYLAVEQLQREVWGLADVEIVPNHLLLTAQKNGGVLLGAFDVPPAGGKEQLVGFVFGFIGLSPGGGVKHCSHMTGVAPAYQSQNLGYRLKLAQRQHVLAQGFKLITWTFDPLESRNANLNFRKLGATCQTYLRDLYGEMRNALNIGLTSDRFQVDWHITSRHVADRLRGSWVGPSLSALRDKGIPLLNPIPPGDPPPPSPTILPLESEQLLVQIPLDFQAIKASDFVLARAWRLHARTLFEVTFAAGYTVVDLLFEDGQSCYLLQKDWTPS